jgi:hypothetical protein
LLLLTGLSTSAYSAQVYATKYDLYNGGTASGGLSLHDDLFSGSGSKGTDYAPLSGGLGDLTDGVVATANWDTQPGPLVGWQTGHLTFLPYMLFYFGSTVNIDSVKIDMNYGYRASSIDLLMGGVTKTFSVASNNPGTANAWYNLPNLGLTGDTLKVTLNYSSDWLMLSEVQFFGTVPDGRVPEPTTMLLLGIGLFGLAGLKRKFNL